MQTLCQLGQNILMIKLIHPEKEVCAAIKASILAVWPDAPLKDDGQIAFNLSGPSQRLGALIRQIQQIQSQSEFPSVIDIAGAVLNTRTREWSCNTETVLLTEKEVGVLLYLWQGGKTATREDLLRDVWQYAADADTHTIETHIYRLRQKIESDPTCPVFLITTKEGYQLAANASA